MQDQLDNKFENDLKDIDMVLGAKGSPLQLVLSAVYHLDAPTGNIKMKEANKILKNPLVTQSIPLAYGDTYEGYRIVGTTSDYLTKYEATFKEGAIFNKSMEAVVGASVARAKNSQLGDTFLSTHGEAGGMEHEGHSFKVVGILNKTNTVLDNLVLTNLASVWQVHSEHDPAEEEEHHHEEGHDHDHEEPTFVADSMDITAALVKFRSPMAMMTLPRVVNDQTTMQAALPSYEITRLFYMLGIGATTLKMIAGGIMLMSGFSVFFVLFNRMRERKHELALLRSLGYRPGKLFLLLLVEGLLLAVIGYILGLGLSRLGLWLVNKQAAGEFFIQFDFGFVTAEIWLLLITLGVGMLAAMIPAIKAMRLDVSTTLSAG